MAADGTSNTLNHTKHGGAVTVIGGRIEFDGGRQTPASGTQAAAITDATGAAGANPTQAEYATVVAKLNAVLAALRGVGIIAT